ncbi:MFS transporter [Balneatrix alpica]|uniref:MFS transporter n=1 Tax=Balneatrix alpica TaxID=75684 RepID=A0ABV5ZBQ7_9GAMM|nr:MFS transporter [Balneatrix alpica]
MYSLHSRPYRHASLALLLGSFMVFANLYLLHPLLPMLSQGFQVSPLQASASFTLSTLTLGLSLLIWAPLSDALGRRHLILLSLTGTALCSLALVYVQSFSQLLLLRALLGLFLGGLPAMAVAYLGDEFEHRALQAAVGVYISGNTLGGIGGRLLGGFIGEGWGWQSACLVMALISLICLLGVSLLLPKAQAFQPQPLHPLQMIKPLGQHLRNPKLLLPYLIGGLNFMVFINLYTYLTFRLELPPFHLTASALGLLFLTYLSGTLASARVGLLNQKWGVMGSIKGGIVLLMLGSLCTLASPLWLIIAGLLINSFGFFLAHATLSSLVNRQAQQAKASASALYLVCYYLGASVGSYYLHPFWSAGGWVGVVLAVLLVLACTLGLSLLLARRLQPLRADARLAGTEAAKSSS